MDYLELAKARYSVRKFSDQPVEEEKLQRILEAARLAPTAKNCQPQRVYVIRSAEGLAKVRAATRMAYNAPVVLMVCYDENVVSHLPDSVYPGYNTGEMDGSIVTDQMMMAATELGLGTLWARGYDTQSLLDVFDLPANEHIVCLLDLGYPADDSHPSVRHEDRKPLDELVQEL